MLFISHDCCFGGAQYVLINIMKWLVTETNNFDIQFSLLVLDKGTGKLLPDFQNICPVYFLDDNEQQLESLNFYASQENRFPSLDGNLITKSKIIYGNTVIAGRIYKKIKEINPNIYIITHIHEL